jgi:hypothetical protein
MTKVLVDKSDLEAALDNLQYYVSYGYIKPEEQATLDQQTIDRLKQEIKYDSK